MCSYSIIKVEILIRHLPSLIAFVRTARLTRFCRCAVKTQENQNWINHITDCITNTTSINRPKPASLGANKEKYADKIGIWRFIFTADSLFSIGRDLFSTVQISVSYPGFLSVKRTFHFQYALPRWLFHLW